MVIYLIYYLIIKMSAQPLLKIKSKIILNKIISNSSKIIKFNLIKYNKKIQ